VRSPIVALVHHPLYLEAGLPAARRARLRALEQEALALAKRVVVTSETTARTLREEFQVAAAKIAVAVPGTDPAPRARGSGGEGLALLSVGAIVPRKAYDILVRALAPLRDHRWHLTIAGPTDRSAEGMAALSKAIAETGLAGRITTLGPIDQRRLASLYDAADAFVLASLYEGYGMALGEAMARGLAIVCTTGGAPAETVPAAAAIKVAPGDRQALSEALRRVLGDASLRRRLAEASWAAGQALPRWEDSARLIAGVVRETADRELA
jgi:glycosyltransferase involved in cell wall biosynthesis